MTVRYSLGVIVAFMAMSPPIWGQKPDTLHVDLAHMRANETNTIPVSPGTYVVSAINLVPTSSYRIQVQQVTRPIAPLAASTAGAEGMQSQAIACAALIKAMSNLGAVAEEEKVPSAKRDVERELKGPCDDGVLRTRASQLLASTERSTTQPIVLNRGTDLKVTVTRTDEDRRWIAVFETGPRGEWRTSYGFSFVIDPWNRSYYSRSTAVKDSFVVTRERAARWMDFIPTLFYSWMPHEGLGVSRVYGLTMGLGFDAARPVALLGGQLVYNQNIGVSIGGAFHPQQILSGRYSDGSVIRDNLGAEQLHQNRYRLSPFISISLRSLTNPFQQPGKASDSTATGGSTRE